MDREQFITILDPIGKHGRFIVSLVTIQSDESASYQTLALRTTPEEAVKEAMRQASSKRLDVR